MSRCGGHLVPVIINRRGSMPSDPIYRSLGLIKVSHKPQDILSEVKRFTWQPDYVQEFYRRQFVIFYRRWIAMETPNNPRKLRKLYNDLQSAMEALDGFFFGGSLTGLPQNAINEYHLTDLQVKNDIFGVGQPGHRAYLDIGLPVILGAAVPLGGGWTTIFIDTLEDGYQTTTKSIFETLVHEMAHAVFEAFACEGAGCMQMATRPSILGQQGHGRLWVEMAEHMTDTIRSWHNDLANFYDIDDILWHNRERN